MNDFKQIIANDIDRVFLNVNEFAEMRMIEGTPVRCAFIEDILNEKSGGTEFGVHNAEACIMAKCADMPTRKGYGSCLNVDGVDYTVISWSEEAGITTIMLSLSTL